MSNFWGITWALESKSSFSKVLRTGITPLGITAAWPMMSESGSFLQFWSTNACFSPIGQTLKCSKSQTAGRSPARKGKVSFRSELIENWWWGRGQLTLICLKICRHAKTANKWSRSPCSFHFTISRLSVHEKRESLSHRILTQKSMIKTIFTESLYSAGHVFRCLSKGFTCSWDFNGALRNKDACSEASGRLPLETASRTHTITEASSPASVFLPFHPEPWKCPAAVLITHALWKCPFPGLNHRL